MKMLAVLTLLLVGVEQGFSQIQQPSITPSSDCTMPVDECITIPDSTLCVGVKLPYTQTSFILSDDSDNLAEVKQNLELWSGLRNVPKCWEVVQPLLCSTYLPKCQTSNNQSFIHLTPWEFCDVTRGPCKIVEATKGWPSFLLCNQSHYARQCESEITSVKFNTTGSCEAPLVPTKNQHSWYKDVDGCGVQCRNPLFTDEEHERMHSFIAGFGSLCMGCTLFAVLTFVVDWKNSSRYPALILFFINGCFFIGSVGWMAQFIPGAWEDIVCRSDGTMRISEPQIGSRSGETASCTVVFVLVYYFMIAGVTWFVILTYCWHLMFRSIRSPIDVIERKRGTFHVFAWSVPLVLTIVCLAVTQVDGDSVTGICFVGYLEHGYRAGFLLVPIALVIIIGLTFMILGLVTLVKIKLGSPGLISERASSKIRDTIIRLGVFASLALGFALVTLSVHLYIFSNEQRWRKSLSDYILCEAHANVLTENKNSTCMMNARPNLVAMQVHVFAYFGAGISMSSWVWNKSTLRTWRRFFRRCWGLPNDEPVKIQKHKVIAQAFSKRRELNQGRLSLSFNSTHDDPMGMRFDLNSLSSHEVSSVWAAAIPRLVQRRGGVTQRRYSDSDVQSIQSMADQISGIISDTESRMPSLHSHGSSGHEEKAATRPEKKRRRKRRKRGMNRVTPVVGGAMSTDPASTANSSRRGSTEHVNSVGTGSQNSSSLATGSEPVRCNSVLSSGSNSSINLDGHINIAFEEHETEHCVSRVFQLKASPSSAFEPYQREYSPVMQGSPTLSQHTVSIASSDTEAMSVKDFKIPDLPRLKPKASSPVLFTDEPPLCWRPQDNSCDTDDDEALPRAPLQFSRSRQQVPLTMHHPLPYTIPVPTPHYTAVHAHTMYSMMPAPPYHAYHYPRAPAYYPVHHKLPDMNIPIPPLGMPVPPVVVKRRPHHTCSHKVSQTESEHHPRTKKPMPTILDIGALQRTAYNDFNFVSSHQKETVHKKVTHTTFAKQPSSAPQRSETGRNRKNEVVNRTGRKKTRPSTDPDRVMVIGGQTVAESTL